VGTKKHGGAPVRSTREVDETLLARMACHEAGHVLWIIDFQLADDIPGDHPCIDLDPADGDVRVHLTPSLTGNGSLNRLYQGLRSGSRDRHAAQAWNLLGLYAAGAVAENLTLGERWSPRRFLLSAVGQFDDVEILIHLLMLLHDVDQPDAGGEGRLALFLEPTTRVFVSVTSYLSQPPALERLQRLAGTMAGSRRLTWGEARRIASPVADPTP
jgi:hypothetical protein